MAMSSFKSDIESSDWRVFNQVSGQEMLAMLDSTRREDGFLAHEQNFESYQQKICCWLVLLLGILAREKYPSWQGSARYIYCVGYMTRVAVPGKSGDFGQGPAT